MLIHILLVILAGFPVVTTNGEQHVPGSLTINGDILQYNNKINSEVTSETTEDFTLYVRTTGNDGNDCLSSGNACLTIQEAVNRVPKCVSHDVTIDIGAGSFAAFNVLGFQFVDFGTDFIIQGTLENPTLTTGTVSGTADAGSTRQLTDDAGPGQNWTVDELRGMLVLINGEYRVVRNNTADTINFAGAYGATCSGKAYEIFEQTTVIDSGTGAMNYGRIEIGGCVGDSSLTLSRLKVDADASGGSTMGVFIYYGGVGADVEQSHLLGGTYTVFTQEIGGRVLGMTETYVTGGNTAGVSVYRNVITRKIDDCYFYGNGVGLDAYQGYVDLDEVYADDNTSHGFRFSEGVQVDLDYAGLDGNGGYGIYIDENTTGNRFTFTTLNAAGTLVIANNTSGGIIARNHSVVALTACTGTGNGNYGLELETYLYATITSATSITGASGNATINDGATTLTWATDFAANGDMAINIDSGCRIERRD